jgi:hypothetical protein
MAEPEWSATETPFKVPLRRRGFPNATVAMRVAKLLMTSAAAATVVGMAVPAHAEPTDPYVYLASATDDTFLRALDGLGIGHPSDPEAVNIARGACGYIQSGHSIREAVDGVRNSYPGMPLLQGAHFVAVARALYCPDTRHVDERGGDTAR